MTEPSPTSFAIPALWQNTAEANEVTTTDLVEMRTWWRQSSDPVLDELIEEALVGSPDTRDALSRIEEAQPRQGVQRSGALPSISGGASGSNASVRIRRSDTTSHSDLPDISGTDNELDQLASILNHTFARLDAAFERQRRFTADAAHELRPPVTILLAETQRILRRINHSVDDYREALQTCHASAERHHEQRRLDHCGSRGLRYTLRTARCMSASHCASDAQRILFKSRVRSTMALEVAR